MRSSFIRIDCVSVFKPNPNGLFSCTHLWGEVQNDHIPVFLIQLGKRLVHEAWESGSLSYLFYNIYTLIFGRNDISEHFVIF